MHLWCVPRGHSVRLRCSPNLTSLSLILKNQVKIFREQHFSQLIRHTIYNTDLIIMSVRSLISSQVNVLLSFPRSGNKKKRGVEFRHSTNNISKIREKMVNIGFTLPNGLLTACEIQRKAII